MSPNLAKANVGGHQQMKRKLTRREWFIATVILVALGYFSASVSLQSCDTAVRTWLPKNAPVGAKPTGHYSEPATLFLPFVAKVSFDKNFYLAPLASNVSQYERGTRYYVTLFGLVFPVWTSSDTNTVVP